MNNRYNLNDKICYYIHNDDFGEELFVCLLDLLIEFIDNKQIQQASYILEFIEKNQEKLYTKNKVLWIHKFKNLLITTKGNSLIYNIKNIVLNQYEKYDDLESHELIIFSLQELSNDFSFLKKSLKIFKEKNKELYVIFGNKYLSLYNFYDEEQDDILINIDRFSREINPEISSQINILELRKYRNTFKEHYLNNKKELKHSGKTLAESLKFHEDMNREWKEVDKKKLLTRINRLENDSPYSNYNEIEQLKLEYKFDHEPNELTLNEIKIHYLDKTEYFLEYFTKYDEKYVYCLLQAIICKIDRLKDLTIQEDRYKFCESILEMYLLYFNKFFTSCMYDLDLNIKAIGYFYRFIDQDYKVFKHKYNSFMQDNLNYFLEKYYDLINSFHDKSLINYLNIEKNKILELNPSNASLSDLYSKEKLEKYLFDKKRYRFYAYDDQDYLEKLISENIKFIKHLINNGVDINSRDKDGISAIFYSLKYRNIRIFWFLIENNADIFIKSNNETTLLHYAASCGNIDIVKYLIDKGIDVNSENKFHEKPIYNAECDHKEEIVDFLIQNGSEKNKLKVIDF